VKAEQVTLHVRLRGGATTTLTLPRALQQWQSRRTPPPSWRSSMRRSRTTPTPSHSVPATALAPQEPQAALAGKGHDDDGGTGPSSRHERVDGQGHACARSLPGPPVRRSRHVAARATGPTRSRASAAEHARRRDPRARRAVPRRITDTRCSVTHAPSRRTCSRALAAAVGCAWASPQGAVTSPEAIRRVLEHLGLPPRAPPLAPARLPDDDPECWSPPGGSGR
jgi:hypothetical protein